MVLFLFLFDTFKLNFAFSCLNVAALESSSWPAKTADMVSIIYGINGILIGWRTSQATVQTNQGLTHAVELLPEMK